ncbi:MAG: tail tape measure protein [Sphingomonas taxi]|uniref:Tail tape measure protein n=1 Tax=Sphingomonas taxi TaxID=1549858 RepID=A0A2W5P877_9SPHN|nr:MAG: tail tape measure protein [Sphingomonas taxi]
MDEEIERLVIGVRADTAGFARDVDAMRAMLEGPFASGADRAGRAVETALARAVRTGKLGFDDLKSVALATMGEIAAAAVRGGIGSVLGGGGLAGVLTGLLGLPGRATGGPVSPGRAYLVGERGPEVFVPTSSGQVAVPGGGARDVRVAITINAGSGDAPAAMARSGRQVARAVRAALTEAG